MAIMPRSLAASVVQAVVCLTVDVVRAELLILDRSETAEYYSHPSIHSLVFITPETRAQAILPPAPTFVAPPPLIWRAPGALPIYPPATPPGFNRSGTPSNRDVTAYNLARAHAFSQNFYRRNGTPTLWFGPPLFTGEWLWIGGASLYPPLAPGLPHPSNRDNASYLLERAHRFSQDAYRKP